MATSRTINCTLHGDGVAATSSYPYIWVGFDIHLERDATDKSKINWYTSGIPDNISLPSSGRYGYQFCAYLAINPADPYNPTWDELWTIIEKDNTTASYWWDESITWRADRSGSFTCTANTATVYLYVKARYGSYECCMNSYGGWCFQDGHEYYLIDSFPVALDPYETLYTVSYNAAGGQGSFPNQTKSSLSNLTLHTNAPTYPLSVNYYNQNGQFVSSDTAYRAWGESGHANTWKASIGGYYPAGGTYTTNSNCNMLAVWGNAPVHTRKISAVYYRVTYNYSGGTGSPSYADVARSTDGYATSSGGARIYGDDANISISGNVNLYPRYGNATLSSLPTPTKQGYRFTGWYTSSGTKVTTPYTVTGNITLTARWEELPIHKFQRNGTWSNENPKVWRFNGTTWEEIAHVLKYDGGSTWTDLSQ